MDWETESKMIKNSEDYVVRMVTRFRGNHRILQGVGGAKARQSRRTLTVEAGKVSMLRGGPDLGGRVQLQGVGGARAQQAWKDTRDSCLD